MKAKIKAPDKIYADPDVFSISDEFNDLLQTKEEGCIEYTRTDAFFEKAKEWFIEHVNIPQNVATNEDGEPLADSYIKYAKARFNAANEMFENFKNYMKGE